MNPHRTPPHDKKKLTAGEYEAKQNKKREKEDMMSRHLAFFDRIQNFVHSKSILV